MKKIIILFAAILLFAISAIAQIGGSVTDAKRNPIANATVKAYGPDKKNVSVTADENGEYTFEGLAPGKYGLSVIAKGFEVVTKGDVVVTDEDDTAVVDFELRPVPTAVAAQPPTQKGYIPEMTALISELNDFGGSRASKELLDISARFVKIGEAQKTEWLPYYYAALAVSNYGWTLSAWSDRRDENADKGNALLNRAEAFSKNNSEIYIVRSMFATQQMMVDPQSRWQSYGQQAGAALEWAKKLNPNNPRVYYLQGISIFGTPEQFGGGKAAAKPLFEEAVRKFDVFRPESALSPNWGRQDALRRRDETK